MALTKGVGLITPVSGITACVRINDYSVNETAETLQMRGEDGKVEDIVSFSKKKQVTISGTYDTARGTLPSAGDKLTIGAVDHIIESVQKDESINQAVKVVITASTSDSAVITPISTTSGT